MKDKIAVLPARPKLSSAIAGKMLRSMPTIAPTKALTRTSRENCAQFSRMPSFVVLMLVGATSAEKDSQISLFPCKLRYIS